MSVRSHFIYKLHLDGGDHYIIWYSDEDDGAFVSENHLIWFGSVEDALHYMASIDTPAEVDENGNFDFDRLDAWCAQPSAASVHCSDFLYAWNLLNDIVRSLGRPSTFGEHEVLLDEEYYELFHGKNLPAITPVGTHYSPRWDAQAIANLAALFQVGIAELRQALNG